MSSIADAALRLASSSRAAFAARSRPSGSNPVTEEPPLLVGALSGAITDESDSFLFGFLPALPNMIVVSKKKSSQMSLFQAAANEG